MTIAGSSRSLPKIRIPGYLLHKPSGRARVRINGEDIYLGEFGSVETVCQNDSHNSTVSQVRSDKDIYAAN